MHITLEIFNRTDCFFCQDKVNGAAGRRAGAFFCSSSGLFYHDPKLTSFTRTWYRLASLPWTRNSLPSTGNKRKKIKVQENEEFEELT